MIQAVSVIHASIFQITNITYTSRKSLPKLMDKRGANQAMNSSCLPTDVLESEQMCWKMVEGVVYCLPLNLRLGLIFQAQKVLEQQK